LPAAASTKTASKKLENRKSAFFLGRLLATGCWLLLALAAGYWLCTVSWLLAAGCYCRWLLATVYVPV